MSMATTLSQLMSTHAALSSVDSVASRNDDVRCPALNLHDLHKFQQSPALSSTPELGHRHVRRKQSSIDLARSARPPADPEPNEAWTPTLILPCQNSLHHSLPPSAHRPQQHPFTPRQRAYTASPSLSSTVTTLQSTPTQTPLCRRDSLSDHALDENGSGSSEPIRTKRKFDSLRRAKRLPRHSSSSGIGEVWQVYAEVFDAADQVAPVTRDVAAESEAAAFVREEAALKKGRSVRFQGIGSEDSQKSCEPVENSAEASSSGEEEENSGSPSVLKRANWPLPPLRDNWTGTFGHLTEAIPPSTVLYRNVSFDVLNPHASLLLGPREFETPAEIDGLLDSYFEECDNDMQYDTLTGEPSQTSPRLPSENSRRVLYDDPNSARRNILRVEDKAPPIPPKAILRNVDHRRKVFSDPFDLTLSESGSNNTLMHAHSALRANETSASRMKAHGLGIADPDDTHATFEPSTDPTIKEILKGYDYTRPLRSPPSEADADLLSSPAIEQGRKTGPEISYTSSNGLMTPIQTPDSALLDAGESFEAQKQPRGVSASLPTPPAPVYTGLHYYSGCSELPTSEQTYGETNQLLLITPEAPKLHTPCSTGTPCWPKTCKDPSHIHVAPQAQPYSPLTPTPGYSYAAGDDGASIADSIDCTRSLVELALGVDNVDQFDFELQGDAAGDISRCVPRSSSFYPDDGEGDWVTEYGASQQDLRRLSKESYANTSFYGSQFRLSIGPPKLPDAPSSPILDKSPPPKAPGLLLREKVTKAVADAKTSNRRLEALDRIKALENKIVDDQQNLKHGLGNKVKKIERQADLAELKYLRMLFPPTDRPLMMASDSMFSDMAAHKKLKANPFSRPNYQTKPSFTKMLGLTRQDSGFNSASDTRGLLASPTTPSPIANNLGFNESTGTFITVQHESPLNTRGAATQLWSPFDKDPTARAIHVSSPLRGQKASNEIELRVISNKSKHSKQAAISNQYEPRDLQLVKSKRMTDAELVAREPGWVNHPSERAKGAPPVQRANWFFGTSQRMLLKPETDIEQALREEQKRISKRYAYACAAFPPLALAFGLGAFDRSIAKKTAGNVSEAAKKEKRNALIVFFPLGSIVWAAVLIAIFVMVTLSKDSVGQRAGGSPFYSV